MGKLTPELETKLKNLPTSAGVYQFKDNHGRIIYIGKAKNLRRRVGSYFTRASNRRIASMVAQIQAIEITATHTEAEALLLENNLIKEHKPRYNVLLKDDKRYPYIRITTTDAYPRVEFTRRINRRDGNRQDHHAAQCEADRRKGGTSR